MIRVLANPIAAEPYLRNQNPLPVGSIVVKEEYDGLDCSNDAELVSWSAMRKEAPGFDPDDGDWHWQCVDAPTRARAPATTSTAPASSASPACQAIRVRGARLHVHRERRSARHAARRCSRTFPPRCCRSPARRRPMCMRSAPIRMTAAVRYVCTTTARRGAGSTAARQRRAVVDQRHADRRRLLHGRRRRTDPAVRPGRTASSRARRRPTAPRSCSASGARRRATLWAVGGDDREPRRCVWHYDGQMWTVQDVSRVVPSGRAHDAVQGVGHAAERRVCGRRDRHHPALRRIRLVAGSEQRPTTRCSPCTATARSLRPSADSSDG